MERAKPQHPDAGPPRSDLIVQARGGAHLYSQDYLRAVRDFSDGLTRGPANARWYGYRALAYMGMQAWDEALGDLGKGGERVYIFLENHYQDIPALESQLHVQLPWQLGDFLSRPDARRHRKIEMLKAARDKSRAAGDPDQTAELERQIKSILIDLNPPYVTGKP